MMIRPDYSKVAFSTGMICINTNNDTKCVVIDGNLGKELDRSSCTLEWVRDHFIINTPPNRALIPTGEFFDMSLLSNVLTPNSWEMVGKENK